MREKAGKDRSGRKKETKITIRLAPKGRPKKASSEDLLLKQASGTKKLRFAIRQHTALRRGRHLDLTIGNPKASLAPDFTITAKTLEDLEGRGKYGRDMSIVEDPHPAAEYLLDKENIIHPIPFSTKDEKSLNSGKLSEKAFLDKLREEGATAYGAGVWKTVVKGTVEQVDDKLSFTLTGDNGKSYQFYRPPNFTTWILKENKES
jgi:hypothetical protein